MDSNEFKKSFNKSIVVVRIEDIYKAFKSGYNEFIKDINNDSNKQVLVYERARLFFKDSPEPIPSRFGG
jgi:hypothetical protein